MFTQAPLVGLQYQSPTQAAEEPLVMASYLKEKQKPENQLANNMAYYRAMLGHQPDFPTLQSGGNNWAEGLGNGIANAANLMNYGHHQRQRVEEANVLSGLQAQHEAQQQAEVQKVENAANMLEGLYPGNNYGVLYKASPDVFGKSMFQHLGEGFGNNLVLPGHGTAEGQAQINKGQAIQAGLETAGVPPTVLNGTVNPKTGQVAPPAPSVVSQYQMLTGQNSIPDVLDGLQKSVNLQESKNRVAAQPAQIQQDAQLKQQQIQDNYLDSQRKAIENHFLQREKELALVTANTKNQKDIEELTRLKSGKQWWNSLLDTGYIHNPDPKVQREIKAQADKYGISYTPYSDDITNIQTGKDKHEWFNKTTHELFRDGKWQKIDVMK